MMYRDTLRRLATGGILAAFLTGISLPASTSASIASDIGDGEDTGVFNNADDHLAKEVGHGNSIVEATDDFRANAIDLLGDRFVEVWLTPAQDHFVVGVLDLQADELAGFEAELSKIAAVEVVNRDVSRQELDDLAAKTLANLQEDVEPVSFGILYDKGVVLASVRPADVAKAKAVAELLNGPSNVLTGNTARAATRQLSSFVPEKPTIAIAEQADLPQLQESHYSAPFKGGKQLLRKSGSKWYGNCTAGVLLRGGTDPQNAYGLTAGHCGPSGQQMAIGYAHGADEGTAAMTLGSLQNNTIWGVHSSVHADAAVFGVPNGNSLTPSIYINNSLSRTVVARTEAAAPYSRVCVSGSVTTSELCGTITLTNQDTVFLPGSDNISHTVHHTYWVQWDNGAATQKGDSGSPIYAVNPDGTAIVVGILSGGNSTHTTFSSIWWSLNLTGTHIRTVDRTPFWSVDQVSGVSGQVFVAGWIIDPDLARTATSVHVYLGGPAGSGDGYAVGAGGLREDVAAVYPNTGSKHGFSGFLTTSRRGNVPVYVYGINIGEDPGGNPLMYSGTVYVS